MIRILPKNKYGNHCSTSANVISETGIELQRNHVHPGEQGAEDHGCYYFS